MALRTPISRVRSVTVTSMMFMMPMPPTTSEMPAMQASSMVKVRVELANPQLQLKPEMFATAAIQTAAKSKAIILPEEAVLLVSGQPTVFIEEHGGFEPRTVALGERLQGRVVIKSGLKPDDLVVIAGAYALKARMLKSQIGEGH